MSAFTNLRFFMRSDHFCITKFLAALTSWGSNLRNHLKCPPFSFIREQSLIRSLVSEFSVQLRRTNLEYGQMSNL